MSDDLDRLRRRVLWAMPSGLYVVGSHATVEGEPRWNLMTANWVTQVAMSPKLVAVSVETGAVTGALIAAGGVFSVSLVARIDRPVVRRFAKPVTELELDHDGRPSTMAGEPVSFGVTGAPVLSRAPAWIECEVRHHLDLGSHLLWVGEVAAVAGPGLDAEPAILRTQDTRMNYGG